MTRRGATLLTGAVLLTLLALLAGSLPVPYVALGPGPTVNTVGRHAGKAVITITGRPTSKSAGHLNLTTVSITDHIDLLSGIRYWLDRRYAVVPREEVYPPGQTTKQADDESVQEFKSSQDSAETAALRQLGYPLQVDVADVVPGGAARSVLRAGDVITSVDGSPVTSAGDVSRRVRAKHPGDEVVIGYRRQGRSATATIRTKPVGGDAKRAAIGVRLSQSPAPPLKVSFDIDNIGGPSAGLMFSLGIIDLLTPADLTGGRFVAGTGTMDEDGRVGPIGGIHQKLVAARAAGATVFLTPAGNCADARMLVPGGLRLVKVESLGGALDVLAALRAGRGDLPSCAS